MKTTIKAASLTAALALMASPALAQGPGTGEQYRSQHQPSGTPPYSGTDNPGTQRATRAEARLAAIRECREERKKGNLTGREFGKCVSAAVRSARADVKPGKACKAQNLSRKPGENGERSPFSACVRAAVDTLRALDARPQG